MPMRVGILGAGFGLYGYLPALIDGCGANVLLPDSYRARLKLRDDIRHFSERVEWVVDEEALLGSSDAIVISRRPEDQIACVKSSFAYTNIKRILLEKPIAPTPEAATSLLNSLYERGTIVRIGFTFRYLIWGQALLAWSKTCKKSPLEITWKFQAHHYCHDLYIWKRKVNSGGGALRFYGIQLVALLAEIGYETASKSVVSATKFDEAENWRAVFHSPSLPDCSIDIQTNSMTQGFSVRSLNVDDKEWRGIDFLDPFETDLAVSGIDSRLPALTAICQDLLHGNTRVQMWYQKSVDLWKCVERVTKSTALKKFS